MPLPSNRTFFLLSIPHSLIQIFDTSGRCKNKLTPSAGNIPHLESCRIRSLGDMDSPQVPYMYFLRFTLISVAQRP